MEITKFEPDVKADSTIAELQKYKARKPSLPLRIAEGAMEPLKYDVSAAVAIVFWTMGAGVSAANLTEHWPIAVLWGSATALFGLASAIQIPSWRAKKKLEQAALPAKLEAIEALKSWLWNSYGLVFSRGYRYRDELRGSDDPLWTQPGQILEAILDGENISHKVWFLEAENGAQVKARFVKVGGSYELRRVAKDPAEPMYFAPRYALS